MGRWLICVETGTIEEVLAVFNSHDLLVKGSSLGPLLADFASQQITVLGVDPTVVSPAAIWIIGAGAGHSYQVQSDRTGSRAPRSAASRLPDHAT